MCLKIMDKIAVFLTKAIILILGFMLYTGLTYGLLGTMQETCDNISQMEHVVEVK